MGNPEPQPPAFHTREERHRRWLLWSRFTFHIHFSAPEFEPFREAYEQFREELHQWHARRGKRCEGVRVDAEIHPWIAGRIRDYLRKLRGSETHAFLAQMPIEVCLTGLDGKPVDHYVLEPNKPDTT